MNKLLIAMVAVILWGSLLCAAELIAWLPENCNIKVIATGEPFAADDGLVNRPRYSSVCTGTMGSYNNENDMNTALQTLAIQYNRPEIKFAGVIRLGCSSDSKQPLLHAGIFRSNMVAAIPMDGVGFIDSKEPVGPTGFWIGDLHNIAILRRCQIR
jgi:hypothetical protein